MKRRLFVVMFLVLIILVVLATLFLKNDVRVFHVSGFEVEDAEIDRKYGDKKIFSPEELETMGREIRDLQERKIKAYKELQSSSRSSSQD